MNKLYHPNLAVPSNFNWIIIPVVLLGISCVACIMIVTTFLDNEVLTGASQDASLKTPKYYENIISSGCYICITTVLLFVFAAFALIRLSLATEKLPDKQRASLDCALTGCYLC